MNNEQFRRLIGGNTPNPNASSKATPSASSRVVALGSKQRSSIPMTPRSVGLTRSDFQQQIWEKSHAKNPEKKSRTSVPKGSRLADGYTDRAKAREAAEEDERAVRIKALEEALKKEEIDQATFDKLQSQIAGGDLSSTHLIKGLDYKLLERVRKGENVFDEGQKEEGDAEVEAEGKAELEDVDDVLSRLEADKVEAIAHETTHKKGQLATIALKPGQKRTRDMILAEMKAARAAAKEKAESALGMKFKKIGAKAPGSRIERDSKGREVLIVVDEDGIEKRKVRKISEAQKEREIAEQEKARDSMMPDPDAKPLGMDVPEFYKQKADEHKDDEVNIFDDLSDDYDPLAGLEEETESGGESDTEASKKTAHLVNKDGMPPPPRPAPRVDAHDYFKDSKSNLLSDETFKAPSMSDPAIQAALKRAASLKSIQEDAEDEETRAKAERRRKMLQNVDRDAEDMDMGFGMSRFEDEADFDDVKLSKWDGGGEDGDGQAHHGKKHKRGGKKRKGDVNNAADVLRVMEEQRKAAGS
jgi:hypothetical protein